MTTFQGTVIYSCDPGYETSDTTTVICQSDGMWSTRPTCTGDVISVIFVQISNSMPVLASDPRLSLSSLSPLHSHTIKDKRKGKKREKKEREGLGDNLT